MKKIFFLYVMGAAFTLPCFSQNMLLLGGEYNFTRPEFWSAGLGFNMKVFKEYFQNDLTFNFGGIRAKEAETTDPLKFLFYVKDNLYFSHDWKWVGVRAGVFASFGIYGITDSQKAADLFFNGGGFAGICILPRSLIAVTIDVSPGYAMAFRVGDEKGIHEGGFSLPLSVGIRFNLDKL